MGRILFNPDVCLSGPHYTPGCSPPPPPPLPRRCWIHTVHRRLSRLPSFPLVQQGKHADFE
ncbi:hypothetical protein PENTCL1PPCAC_5070, partial [Pristionchus entomophagus]